MALQKQNININITHGLDTKSDAFSVVPGKFVALSNTVFKQGELLAKRNGFGNLPALPDTTYNTLTTYGGGLTAVGTSVASYSEGSGTWNNKGTLQPIDVSAQSVVRTSGFLSQVDCAVSSGGLACAVFTDNTTGPTVTYRYSVFDSNTGQQIVSPSTITVSSGTLAGAPRVFAFFNYFVIALTNNVGGTLHLQYKAIPINSPTSISTEVDISTQYTPSSGVAFDGVVSTNGNLYFAWNGSDGGGAIRMTYLDMTLAQHNTVVFAGRMCTLMSTCMDETANNYHVWAYFYDSTATKTYALCVNAALVTILSPTQVTATAAINVASAAKNGVLTAFYETANNYAAIAGVKTNFIKSATVTEAGVVVAGSTLRSVGLASKAFISNGTIYVLTAYGDPGGSGNSYYQSSFFLVNSSFTIVAKLAYSNGGGYLSTGLPVVSEVSSTKFYVPYLFKASIQAVSRDLADITFPVFANIGGNLATLTFSDTSLTSEIGGSLNISGGFLWMFDGNKPVENNFHVWPDDTAVTIAGAGSVTAQDYYYALVYEWTDNQGRLHRSSPSIPKLLASAAFGGVSKTVNIEFPTLRLTAKSDPKVSLVVYRRSSAQQVFHQVTSITSPTLNDPTVDSVTIVDNLADASIVGNNILYTTGGVVENIGPPSVAAMTLFKTRLMLLDGEDRNLIWYSKQVIESVPVEMSDLFTMYVAPTAGAQGSTGDVTALSAMDEKFIIFKDSAIYYVTGNGPDNTGFNNDFSDPIFITGTVGCSNQNSIVFMPQGLMFQSDKGIWLLGRDLSTTYIGADVEGFNSDTVISANTIPGTNEVRFTLASGTMLVYDYFFSQWGTYTSKSASSSTLFHSLHTYLNSRGEVYQETPGLFLDGADPVLMSFTTGWFGLGGLQGFERAYEIYLLANYFSPHKLTLQIAFDYDPAFVQSTVITPDNFQGAYGSDPLYGNGSPYGGPSNVEQWRVFLARQKCQAFQLACSESFDPSMGVAPGAGFQLSGLNLIIGTKSAYPRIKAARSVG